MVREGLAGAEGEVPFPETPQSGDRHGRLQVTGHADLVALGGRQAALVEDAHPDLFPRADAAPGEPDVLGGGSVAALAADPLGERSGEDLGRGVGVAPGRQVGVGGVAEDAFPSDAPEHPFMLGPVEAGGHAPAPGLAVPGERELVELAAGRAVEVGPGVVSRSQDPVHILFELVDRTALGIRLPAAEDEPALRAADLHVLSRGRVEEGRRGEVLDVDLRTWPAEGAGHPLLLIGLRERRVAELAGALVDVARGGSRGHMEPERRQVAGDPDALVVRGGRLLSLGEQHERQDG